MSTHQGQGSSRGGQGFVPFNRMARWGMAVSTCLLLVPSSSSAQGQQINSNARITSQNQNQPSQYPSPTAWQGSPHRQWQWDDDARPTARNFNSTPMTQSGIQPAGGPYPEPVPGTPVIQQVQNTSDSARAVHHLIEAMPTSMEDLDVIERRSQLIITKANIVRMAIADQSILDVAQYSPKEISLIGLARGSTSLTLWFEGNDDPLIYLVKVIRDPSLDDQRRIDFGKLERKLAVLFPNSKVYLIPMSSKLIVRGQARDQEEAANILNIIQGEVISQNGSLWGGQANAAGYGGYGGYGGANGGDPYFNQVGGFGNAGGLAGFLVNELHVPGEYQINLRWRVAELNRTAAKNLSVDLNVLFANGRHVLSSTMGAAAGGSNLAGVFENGEIGVFMNWLASNGTAKILTEPNVTVLSGRPAQFLSGGEFAVPTVVGISGAAGQTTTFRGFGTSVVVTPTVVDRDLIRLMTVAEFSQLNTGNSVNNIPGLNTRRVQTTVELREGQTFMLGGLLSHTQSTVIQRIPVLGNIPKIGPILFSNKTSTMDETELIILVTPEIVRPMDAHEVPPVPGFEVTAPNDYEFWKYNMTEGLPDTGYYQLPPYGSGSVGTNVGYQHFNPGPANSLYSPVPTANDGATMPNGPATTIPSAPPMDSYPSYTPPASTPNQVPVPPSPSLNPTTSNLPPMMQQSSKQRSLGNQRPGTVSQAGWTGPNQKNASPQTIVPMNYSKPPQGNPGKSARNRRDQQGSSRY